MVFNYHEGSNQSKIVDILSEHDMTVVDYPRQYEGCPLLTIEMINHCVRSGDSWLLLGQRNVLLMHCERGGWPMLAFMLAALLIYRNIYSGEQKTLDIVYRQAPRELLQLMSSFNPVPSQLRYLQYVSRRNLSLEWPPPDRALMLDCVILRLIPNMDGEGGCRPVVRIYGQDPSRDADRTIKVLFSTPKKSRIVRHFKQTESELLKIDIHCHVQGDVVLECISLDDDLEHEQMMFRVMFSTAFIRSNILMLNRDEIDTLWDSKDKFPKDFRTEVIFSEMDSASSDAVIDMHATEEKEGLPIEAFATVQEMFSNVDWMESDTDVAQNVLQKLSASTVLKENVEMASPQRAKADNFEVSSSRKFEEKPTSPLLENSTKSSPSNVVEKKIDHPPKIISPRILQSSRSSAGLFNSSFQTSPTTIQRFHSSPSSLGITALLHDHDEYRVDASSPVDSMSAQPSDSSVVSVSNVPKHANTLDQKPPSSPSIPTLDQKSPPSPSFPPPPPPTASSSQHSTSALETDSSNRLDVPSPQKSTTKSSAPLPPVSPSTPPISKNASLAPPRSPSPPPPPSPPLKQSSSFDALNTLSTPPPPPPPHCVPQKVKPPLPPPAPPTTSLSSNPGVSTSAPPPPPPPKVISKEVGSTISPKAPPVPPPPMPIGNGLPRTNGPVPPPPGPPGAKGGVPSRVTPRTQGQSKKANLKVFHWLKLTRVMQGSIWAEAQKCDEASKAPDFDMSELEDLFPASVPKSEDGGIGGTSRRAAGHKIEKVQLIDIRRAYNCEIMLSKVKIPLTDLMNAVLALDDSALDIDQVENLIKFCPNKEEMDLLKGYKGDKENLGKCEQFFLELMKVPRVEAKLRVFSFKMQFKSQLCDLRNNLQIVNSASEEIRTSAKLKRVMQTILSLGNALNQGTARGSALGFRLDSLLKLTDTRACNNKMTLMHYLCKVLAEKLPELLDFPKDLVSLEGSTKIQLKFLAEEMQAISKGLEKVVQELTTSGNDGPVSEAFCKILKEFLAYAEGEVRALASLYSIVGRNADALAIYFGEDPAKCPFEQVVSTLLNFVGMFIRAHDENCKQLELEKKKAEKEAENEKLKTASRTKADSDHNIPSPRKIGAVK
ncbi:hypothetical protein RND81_10G158900 [Saponaria officinalis]